MSYSEDLIDTLNKCEDSHSLYDFGLELIRLLEVEAGDKDNWKDTYKAQVEDVENLNKLCENWYNQYVRYERLYKKAIAQVVRLRNRLRADPSGTAKTWDWKHWRASILKICLKAEEERDRLRSELEELKSRKCSTCAKCIKINDESFKLIGLGGLYGLMMCRTPCAHEVKPDAYCSSWEKIK